jgi:hypothetical protein
VSWLSRWIVGGLCACALLCGAATASAASDQQLDAMNDAQLKTEKLREEVKELRDDRTEGFLSSTVTWTALAGLVALGTLLATFLAPEPRGRPTARRRSRAARVGARAAGEPHRQLQ